MGRPKNPRKTVKISLSLDNKTINFLKAKGSGNASLAIRQIVADEMKKNVIDEMQKEVNHER